MDPIRVLRVIARLNVGGPALHVSYLSSELDRIGYETTLVAGTVGESEGSMEWVARDRGVEPVLVRELQREISPLADADAVRKLLKLIREVRPDVLHTHTAKAGAVGRIAANLAGPARPKVVVHTYHGHVLRGYFNPVQTAVFRTLERSLGRTSDALIAVSPQVRDDLVRLGVAPANKIVVIRLGLDLEDRLAGDGDARAELGIPPDRFVVGWFGRMTEIKRADVLLHAFADLHARVPDTELLLVGDGPLAPRLEALADELGIQDATRFLGYRDDVGRLYAACDVLALTSANEGTPVSVIEAQAAGLPIVATDVGGVRDVVDDGRTGLLVPSGDAAGVARELERLARDPALRQEMGEAGRLRVTDKYSVPRLVRDVDLLYRSLLATKVTPRVVDSISRPLPKTLPSVQRRTTRTLRVLLVSQYFPPEVGATQSRIQAFAEYLADRGHDVTVICEFPNHPQGVIPPQYRGRLVVDDRSNSYRVLRVWVSASEEKTQRTRMAFYLSFMGLATAVAPRAGHADVVLATSPPLFVALAGAAIAEMKGAPFVLDVRDLWPAAATSLQQIDAGWQTDVAEWLEAWLYRRAAAVCAVTRPFCGHIDRIRERSPKTVLIPNGTLDQFLEATPTNGSRLGVADDSFLVTFAGTLGIAQALPSVLRAAEQTNSGVEFAFVGAGPMRDALEAQVRERGLDNVAFHPQMPLEAVPPVLASSDALLVPLSKHPTFEQFVPSKLIDFMATGRPVIVSAAGEAARILEASGGGIAVPPEDPDALASAVRWLVDHPAEAEQMGQRGRAFAARRLRSDQAARLEAVLVDAVERAERLRVS